MTTNKPSTRPYTGNHSIHTPSARELERRRQVQALAAEWDDGYAAGRYDYRNNRAYYNTELCEEMGENWSGGYAAGHAEAEVFGRL
jgi:hypothetical protein